MSYRWVEQTAELELEIEAPTEEAVLVDALRALGELLGDGPRGDSVRKEVTLKSNDREALLVEWIDELVYLVETEDLVPEDVEQIELSGHRVLATVSCHRGNPRHLVKGATYHHLAFERCGGGFRATVVLDV